MYRGYFLILGIDPIGNSWMLPDERRPEDPTRHIASDYFGRQLLWWYLFGNGKERVIWYNPGWTSYMTAHEKLRKTVRKHLVDKAWKLCEKRGNFTEKIVLRFPASFPSGERIVGYDYLGGTNPYFLVKGTATVTHANPDASGCKCCTVKFDNKYLWFDVMDPNPKYDTDNIKAFFGWVITGGDAKKYDIDIKWRKTSTYKLDENCEHTQQGWPLEKNKPRKQIEVPDTLNPRPHNPLR